MHSRVALFHTLTFILIQISDSDGQLFSQQFPDQYLSGSIHYFRVHPSDWEDRLHKLKWAGFHAVQTYVEWASHEPEPGTFDFSGGLDLIHFIETAENEGLKVILRPGPYICAEREMGGLPWWLLHLHPTVNLRTSDERFMTYVRRWFDILLPLIKPKMVYNGGPVTMVQVENEYGNFPACDFEYLTELSDIMKNHLGDEVFLFTTDNGRTDALKCAKIPSSYATVDFGTGADIESEFESQKLFNDGPLINSEFYPGWLDHWGLPHQTKSTEKIVEYLDEMLSRNASVNFYVFHGGTNFGFGSGADDGSHYQSNPTSYDYDAPISEAGDLTKKYFAIREIALKYFPENSEVNPPSNTTKKIAYGNVSLQPLVSLFHILPKLNSSESLLPKTFEELYVPNGVVVYQTVLTHSVSSPGELSVRIHDRGYIYIDENYEGTLSREEKIFSFPIIASINQTITIAVESLGRVNVGANLNDFKGLVSTPTINRHIQNNWKMIPLPLNNTDKLRDLLNNYKTNDVIKRLSISKEFNTNGIAFYEGFLNITEEPQNTFMRTDNFKKGYVWINDFLLGRYWPVMGPQLTLYVPHGILKEGENYILILELEGITSTADLYVSFVEEPDLNGPVPNY